MHKVNNIHMLWKELKRDTLKKWGALFIGIWTMVFLNFLVVQGESIYENPETGYEVIIEDDADLLSDEEEEALHSVMKEITLYGNAAFKTVSVNHSTTEMYIRDFYHEKFGNDSGTVFLIDMDNRNIWIHSDGAIYDRITADYADTITDNVYTYASNADYYRCGYKVFEQELTLLQGEKIAQPMKYISNAFLAVILALLLNYFMVKIFSGTRKPSHQELLRGIFTKQNLMDFHVDYTHETRIYSPLSDGGGDSGGGSSGGGGGSSGGGGGSSGGGGGHSF